MMALAEKLRRLSEMNLPEIRFRAARKLRIAREQWQLAHGGSRSPASPWWRYWDVGQISDSALQAALNARNEFECAQILPAYFAGRKAPRFYWDLASRRKLVAAHQHLFPNRTEELRAEADALCEHRFRIFAYPEVSCGAEVPWRRDLVNGVESGLEHYARIPYLDFTRVGDSKVTWELNRHQHFLTLGQAYLVTGSERYAEECLTQWEHWQREDPYLRGISWASSLEVAFRSWSWLWLLQLLSGSRALTGRRIGELTAALGRNAEFIAANLSTYFSPNTHLLGEGFALFCIGLLLPELRGSGSWRESGRAILLEQMDRQVREDGSHIEQSTYYHRYAVEFFLGAAMLAERNECPFPLAYRERLELMVEFLQSASLPGVRDPMIGDSDGGRLIAFGGNEPTNWRPLLSTAALYFRRGDFRSAAKGFHEAALWLFGPEASSGFASLESASPRETTSRTFPNAGLVTMRSDWSDRAKLLLFDAGPQGVGICAHGHADALGFVCSAGGTNWLVDPGTYVYTASRPWRDFFRSTRAHNTLVVDGQDQANPVDFFKWRAAPEVRLEHSASTGLLDYAVGVHSGYMRLLQPVEHRRRIIFVKPEYWIISDELAGQGTHHLEFFFHFAPGVTIEQDDEGWLALKDGGRFRLVPAAPGVSFRVVAGEESPFQGWYSGDYGHREPAPALVGSIYATMPSRFVWLLMPAPIGPVRLHDRRPGGLNLAVETDAWADFILGSGASPEALQTKISTDAELAFGRHRSSGELAGLTVINGSLLEVGGHKILQAEGKLDELCVTRSAGGLSVRARPAVPFRLYAPDVAEARLNGEKTATTRANKWIEFRGET
jgi:heparinase II/III-like protein